MSRHHAHARLDSRPVLVVAGYDRPLKEVFLQVLSDDSDPQAEEVVLYGSLYEPERDWRSLDTLSQVLTELGLTVPASLLAAVRSDQAANAGNRVAVHHHDRPPELLSEG